MFGSLVVAEDMEKVLLLVKNLYHHFDDKTSIFTAVVNALNGNESLQKLAISIVFKYKLEDVLD